MILTDVLKNMTTAMTIYEEKTKLNFHHSTANVQIYIADFQPIFYAGQHIKASRNGRLHTLCGDTAAARET